MTGSVPFRTEVLSLVRTQDLSVQLGFPYLIETSRLDGDDLARRHRVSLDHRWLNAGVFERIEWHVYWQDSFTRQDTFEDRIRIGGRLMLIPGARVKGEGEVRGFSLSGYENRYRDFIESFVSLGVDPDSGLLVFQSQNLTRVRIRGVEFRGLLNLGR